MEPYSLNLRLGYAQMLERLLDDTYLDRQINFSAAFPLAGTRFEGHVLTDSKLYWGLDK